MYIKEQKEMQRLKWQRKYKMEKELKINKSDLRMMMREFWSCKNNKTSKSMSIVFLIS